MERVKKCSFSLFSELGCVRLWYVISFLKIWWTSLLKSLGFFGFVAFFWWGKEVLNLARFNGEYIKEKYKPNFKTFSFYSDQFKTLYRL